MNPFEIIESPDHVRLRVHGDVSIQNAQTCLEALRDFQSRGHQLQLDLDNVTSADISFLQLICSLHRTCLQSDRHLTISGEMPDTFKAILDAAGYQRTKACTTGGTNPCLWAWRKAS